MPQLATKQRKEEHVLHYPSLRTVMLIEETIKELGVTTKTNLFKALKNRVMWQTMETVIDYLHARGMVAFDKEGKIVWAHDPELVRRYLKKRHLNVWNGR
ncbi:MAG: hypothetical protein HY367_00925 [Candidatus Aenigmarchaeota archaeon]|nr:hypothetical protein [Candidatus Aenigmarchaeota archaeon]